MAATMSGWRPDVAGVDLSPQSSPARMPQRADELSILDGAHQLWFHPARRPHPPGWCRSVERTVGCGQVHQPLEQCPARCRGEARADVPDVDQPARLVVGTKDQGAERSTLSTTAAGNPACDDHVRRRPDRRLQPQPRPCTRAVNGVDTFADHTFEAVGGGGIEHGGDRDVGPFTARQWCRNSLREYK